MIQLDEFQLRVQYLVEIASGRSVDACISWHEQTREKGKEKERERELIGLTELLELSVQLI